MSQQNQNGQLTSSGEKTNHRPYEQGFRFFDECYSELKLLISAVMEQEPHKDEVYRRPSELLEIARAARAVPWKIAATKPTQA
jgi:hypothetical protein